LWLFKPPTILVSNILLLILKFIEVVPEILINLTEGGWGVVM